jgi:antitoxin component of MazEF toxin-antitoxin module
MLAKLTSKNQITLPKSIVQQVEKTQYFEVQIENGRIMLTPMRVQPADLVRNKLADLGISENDVEDAVAWARQERA